MKFLEYHDFYFDVCRAFLVVSMVFTHVFETLYTHDYNRNLTYFVTIGFVFISGLTIGALYNERMKIEPGKYAKKLLYRSLKLIMIYIFCNVIVLVILPERLMVLKNQGVKEILLSLFLGTNQGVFGFDILVPIAFTSFFSLILLKMTKDHLKLMVLFFFVLATIEFAGVLDYYGIKLLLVGMIGCLLGTIILQFNWDNAVVKLLRCHVVLINALFLLMFYVFFCFTGWECNSMLISLHLFSTIAILLVVYLTSRMLNLNDKQFARSYAVLLSKFMLFSYLFHILLLNILFVFIQKDSLSLYDTVCVGFLVLLVTTAACHIAEIFISKSLFFSRVYTAVFKL
jgi:hypothetical protein